MGQVSSARSKSQALSARATSQIPAPIIDRRRPSQQDGTPPIESKTERYMVIFGAVAFISSVALFIYIGVGPGRMVPQAYRSPKFANKQGSLVVYPNILKPRQLFGFNRSYIINLSDESTLSSAVQSLNGILIRYPGPMEPPYVQCYVSYPGRNSPCFFSRVWVEQNCSAVDNYGYSEVHGLFSPCFLLRVEDSKTWNPIPENKRFLPPEALYLYDPSFVPVFCHIPNIAQRGAVGSISVTPTRGFPISFFPQSAYDPSLYIPPIVAVKLDGIRYGHNVTIECGLLAENSLMLLNNGVVRVSFVFNKTEEALNNFSSFRKKL